MTQVPASSHGTPFNGGTITQPLVIAPSDSSTIPLSIEGSWNAWSTDFFRVLNTDTNTRMFAVDVSGQTLAFPHTSEGAGAALQTTGSTPASTALGGVSIVGSLVGAAKRIGLFGAVAAAQPSVTSGTVTPEQLAQALQTYGALGGT